MENLFIPSRFEAFQLKNITSDSFKFFIHAIPETLEEIDSIYSTMEISCQGAFMILLGKSGAGKTTFLHTLPIFKQGIEVLTIENGIDISSYLANCSIVQSSMRMILIEGREAIKDSSSSEIEKSLHSINQFIRSKNGLKTLVVWLCNKAEMKDALVSLAKDIGGESLVGNKCGYISFNGPTREQYFSIVQKTISTLNDGQSFNNLGIAESEAQNLIESCATIGEYLATLRKMSLEKLNNIKRLVNNEQCKMWVVVVAGNDPKKDVSSLTSGQYGRADIDRLMVSTAANIVEEIKAYPNSIGQLFTFWDCKIIFLSELTAQAIIRDYANEKLRTKMKSLGLKSTPDFKSNEKVLKSELIKAFKGEPMGMGQQGAPPGSNSLNAFEKIAQIAASSDVLLNEAIGDALKKLNIIAKFELEQDFGSGLTRRTDILCHTSDGETVRLEMMWRKKTGQAEISNYVLTKLFNYGKAIKLI